MNVETRRNLRRAAAGMALVACLLLIDGATASKGGAPCLADEVSRTASNGAGIVRILAPSAAQPVGGNTTVEIWLENVVGFYGVDIRLSFDSDMVRVPSGQVTPLWDVFDSSNHFIIKNQVDNDAGMAWFAVTNMNPSEPFTGTGRVCSITFSGQRTGSTAIEFAYVKGSSRDGAPLYPQPVDGILAIGEWRAYLPAMQRHAGGG